MKIIHVSDLHFGRQDKGPAEALSQVMASIGPQLIVISGDLTQTASNEEFRLVRAFMDGLPCPYITIPGNHDIPEFPLTERFFAPYKRYKTHISDNLFPVMQFDEMVIAGLNSARPVIPHWNWANGRLSRAQFVELEKLLGPDDGRWRLCTFHHPIHKMEDSPLDLTVFGGKRAMKRIAELQVDLVMTGHVHHASITTLGTDKHKTVYLSASTTLSNRIREQENGFNLITLKPDEFTIEHYRLRNGGFSTEGSFSHKRITVNDPA
jgi:3',5'-cyclic AMP phosphodiesterase CpdA